MFKNIKDKTHFLVKPIAISLLLEFKIANLKGNIKYGYLQFFYFM